jgi:hypothetical protein
LAHPGHELVHKLATLATFAVAGINAEHVENRDSVVSAKLAMKQACESEANQIAITAYAHMRVILGVKLLGAKALFVETAPGRSRICPINFDHALQIIRTVCRRLIRLN